MSTMALPFDKKSRVVAIISGWSWGFCKMILCCCYSHKFVGFYQTIYTLLIFLHHWPLYVKGLQGRHYTNVIQLLYTKCHNSLKYWGLYAPFWKFNICAGISAILVPLSNVPKLLLSLHSLTALLNVFIVAGVSIDCVTFIEGFHYSWYLNW